MIAVIAGGVGAARMLAGLRQVVAESELTAIINTGDDMVLHGLHISPDIDTITYTLADAVNPETGWGLKGETWQAMESLERYGGQTWFSLGDRDLATHMYRTQRFSEGATLAEVTAEVALAWGLDISMVPMTNDRVETMVTLTSGEEISFQDYFVARQHSVPVSSVRFAGAEASTPSPGVLDTIEGADKIVIAPSNPLVSIDPVLAVPGIRAAIEARRGDVVAVSPIIAGAALKGPADRLLNELGHEASVSGVAQLYRDLARVLVIDHVDADQAAAIAAAGMESVAAESIMKTPEIAKQLAQVALDA